MTFCFSQNAMQPEVHPMPETAGELAELLKPAVSVHFETRVMLEQVNAMPKQGVTSMFTFGRGLGRIEGVIETLRLPYEFVRPQVWQAALRIPPRKKRKQGRKTIWLETQPEFKKRLLRKARQLFPRIDVKLEIADSLLIAEYCRRLHEGMLR